MTDADAPQAAEAPIPSDLHARRADILRIGNRAAAAVQAANRQRGIANWYSLRGCLVSDAAGPAAPAATRPPSASSSANTGRFHAAAQRGEQLGLNGDELAFYDALATDEAAVRELGEETLKAIAVELKQRLRASVTVDWSVRETVRAQLRVMVKTLLKRYKYPPDGQEEATETVLKQADSLSAEWVQ
jgi:hypothetical protein